MGTVSHLHNSLFVLKSVAHKAVSIKGRSRSNGIASHQPLEKDGEPTAIFEKGRLRPAPLERSRY